MAKRQKLYCVFTAQGEYVAARYIESEARKIMPAGGYIKLQYKPANMRPLAIYSQ